MSLFNIKVPGSEQVFAWPQFYLEPHLLLLSKCYPMSKQKDFVLQNTDLWTLQSFKFNHVFNIKDPEIAKGKLRTTITEPNTV